MDDNEKLGRHHFTPRVRGLFGTAMRAAAHAKLSIDLAEPEARELSVCGNLETALKRLSQRLTVRRAVPGVELDRRAQVRMAVYELAAEAMGGVALQSEIIRRAVEAEQRFVSIKARNAETGNKAQQLLDESRASSPAQRAFIRRADRLRRSQLNRLRAFIFDSAALNKAIGNLDEIYGRYLSAAIEVDA